MDGKYTGGHTAILAGWDGKVRAVLTVADSVKLTSKAAIAELRKLGLTSVLLAGDKAAVAHTIAAEVGITAVIAEVLPLDKVEVVKGLQAQGKVVAMAGDGVNDAAALAQADLGLAMGTGTDVAIEASDLTLVRGDLMAAVDAIRLPRKTLATIRGNPVLGVRLQRGGTVTWFGTVLTHELTEAVAGWVNDGGPGIAAIPEALGPSCACCTEQSGAPWP